jgi:hypothetical protein
VINKCHSASFIGLLEYIPVYCFDFGFGIFHDSVLTIAPVA